MGKNKWDKVVEYLNTTKADPEKVLNSLKTIYSQTRNSSSAYHTLRSSWPIDVVWNIYNKTGTNKSFLNLKKKKILPVTEVIRNWVKSDDYMIAYKMFHPGPGNDMYDLPGQDDMMKIKLYKDLPIEKHIRNCNDIWISAKGKRFRKDLEDNDGQFPFKNIENFIVDDKKLVGKPKSHPKKFKNK